MTVAWDVAVRSFIEVFVALIVGLIFQGIIFMELIVNWQNRMKAFIISFILTLILVTIFYVIYALVRVYVI